MSSTMARRRSRPAKRAAGPHALSAAEAAADASTISRPVAKSPYSQNIFNMGTSRLDGNGLRKTTKRTDAPKRFLVRVRRAVELYRHRAGAGPVGRAHVARAHWRRSTRCLLRGRSTQVYSHALS